jgi:hypothetical protein
MNAPNLWTPEFSTLYDVVVMMRNDTFTSYTGFRTIEKREVDGVTRPMLNGQFIFMSGTLDQGFWPDGIYTPPNREAMIYNFQVLKGLGLIACGNM